MVQREGASRDNQDKLRQHSSDSDSKSSKLSSGPIKRRSSRGEAGGIDGGGGKAGRYGDVVSSESESEDPDDLSNFIVDDM